MRHPGPAVPADDGSTVATFDTLVAGLARLGVPRRPVLVHCSMRGVGPVAGGPATLLAAIREVVGPDACVVVPTQTAHNSTTSPIHLAATRDLSAAERAAYIERITGFEPTTPSYGMGALAEHVRSRPGAVRSTHPQTSFTALGPAAGDLMRIHDLDCHLGPRSPLGALYEADASVLLIGVGYDVCTAFHLAEYRAGQNATREYRCFIRVNGERKDHSFMALDLYDGDFDRLGKSLEAADASVRVGRVGRAECRLLSIRRSVDFAIDWMGVNRSTSHT